MKKYIEIIKRLTDYDFDKYYDPKTCVSTYDAGKEYMEYYSSIKSKFFNIIVIALYKRKIIKCIKWCENHTLVDPAKIN